MIGPYLKRLAPLNDGADPMIKAPMYFAGVLLFIISGSGFKPLTGLADHVGQSTHRPLRRKDG